MATRRRTRARELALQYLYSLECTQQQPPPDAADFLFMQSKDEAIRAFALDLIEGCLLHRERVDAEIKSTARNWDLARLAVIDRNVLRIGTYELLFREDVPPQVTLNEAIELAKRFSTEKSGAFVNGLLDKIRAAAKRDPSPKPPRPAGKPERAPEPAGEIDEPLDDWGDAPEPAEPPPPLPIDGDRTRSSGS